MRGSTTRGGTRALRQLIRHARQGADLVVTPDGPQGPRHIVQGEVVALARLTGFPIVPVSFMCSKKKVFSSWDNFMVPYPWGKGIYMWGQPIWIDAKAGPDELEFKRVELENALNQVTKEADAAVQG